MEGATTSTEDPFRDLSEKYKDVIEWLNEPENYRTMQAVAYLQRIAELEEFVRECAKYRVAWAEKLLEKGKE